MKYILFIAALLFIGPTAALASSGILIGPIQASGVTVTDEFIVLINSGATSVDIGAWSIQYKSAGGSTFYKKNFAKGASVPPAGTYLIAGSGYAGDVVPDMKHSSFSLSSAGGTVFLVANQMLLTSTTDPAIVDQKTYDAEATAPGAVNEAPNPATTAPPVTPKQTNAPKIVINEFMPVPNDSNEWIELYNPTSYAVDLKDWTVADGTGKSFIALDGLILPSQFKLIELTSSHLNNSGDLVILRNADKTEIDVVAYGDWDNSTANAAPDINPTPTDIAIARLGDGVDSNRDNYDFVLTSSPTPGVANIITPVKNQEPTTPLRSGSAGQAKTQGKSQELNSKNQADLQWLADLIQSKNSDLSSILRSNNNVIIINNLYLGNETTKPIATANVAAKATKTAAATTTKTATKTAGIKTANAKAVNTVEGQIIAPVGLTGKDMAIVRESDRSVEVRLPKDLKTPPALGDIVSGSGAWSTAKALAMPRLLVKTATAFSVTDHDAPPEPAKITMAQANDHLGELVETSGTIVEKQPTRFRLADGETSLLIKSAFAGVKGDKVAANGLLTKSGSDLLLTPLTADSLAIIKPPPTARSPVAAALPYAIAALPAGLLAGTVYVGKRLKKRKGVMAHE